MEQCNGAPRHRARREKETRGCHFVSTNIELREEDAAEGDEITPVPKRIKSKIEETGKEGLKLHKVIT